MTNQIQGETLFKGIYDTDDEFVYSPWMPVMGDKATFGIEVLQMTASTTIKWGVETRTLEDPTANPLFSDVAITSTLGVSIKEADDIMTLAQELVRYRISTGQTPDASKWTVLRVLDPSWQRDR